MSRSIREIALLGTTALVLTMTLCASPLHAQAWPGVSPGTRIRIAVPDAQPEFPRAPQAQGIVGTLVSAPNDSLYLRLGSGTDTLRLAQSAVLNLSVSRGISRTRSAMEHGLTAAMTFAAMGILFESHRGGDRPATNRVLQTALTGGALGFLSGATVGALRPSEDWRRVER